MLLGILGLIGAFVIVNVHRDSLPGGAQADRIVVYKGKRTLELWKANVKLKQYKISLGRNPVGPKTTEGDGRTPEGRYSVDYRNPDSRFHRSLHITYPDSSALRRAKELKVPPGGMIMIHGIRNGLGWIGNLHRLVDWTDGCIAVTNPEIEEIWQAVPDGTPIEIYP